MEVYKQLLAEENPDPVFHTYVAACLYYMGLYEEAEASAAEVHTNLSKCHIAPSTLNNAWPTSEDLAQGALAFGIACANSAAQGRSGCAVLLFFCTSSQPLACDAGASMSTANTHPVPLCTQDWSGRGAHGVPSAAR